MGLGISFSRKRAIKAGLQVKRVRLWLPTGVGEDEYEEELIRVPDTVYETEDGHLSEMWASNINGHGEIIYVLASKWGRVYAPLTAWLKENEIEWEEV